MLLEAEQPAVEVEDLLRYNRLIQQGEARGEAKGKAEGALEGRRSIVRKQLALKFGALGGDTLARLEAATLEELDTMAERILSATCADEVLG